MRVNSKSPFLTVVCILVIATSMFFIGHSIGYQAGQRAGYITGIDKGFVLSEEIDQHVRKMHEEEQDGAGLPDPWERL